MRKNKHNIAFKKIAHFSPKRTKNRHYNIDPLKHFFHKNFPPIL
jgi:hypothetical protein